MTYKEEKLQKLKRLEKQTERKLEELEKKIAKVERKIRDDEYQMMCDNGEAEEGIPF